MESAPITSAAIRSWLVVRIAEILESPAEEVDVDVHFNGLGMDSLSLLTLTGDLAQWLDRDLASTVFLKHPTIAQLSHYLASTTAEAVGEKKIGRADRDQPLPLTFSQERVLGYSGLGPEGDYNIVCLRYRVTGELNRAALQQALNAVVGRHEILRTTFVELDERWVQAVHPPAPVKIESIDLAGDPAAEAAAMKISKEAAARSMNLQLGPLFRALLMKLGPDNHRLVFVMHHILCDVEALAIFREDLGALYSASCRGEDFALPEPLLQVGDFAVWQRDRLRKDGEAYQSRLAWWQQHWGGAVPLPLALPFLWKKKPEVLPAPVDCNVRRELPKALVSQVRALGRQEGATAYTTFLAALTIVLNQLTGEDDLVVGTYVSNRNRPALARLMGVFLSMLPLRISVQGDLTFREVLARTRYASEQAALHQEVPLEDLQKSLHDAGKRSPDVRVIFQYVLVPGGLNLAGLEADQWKIESRSAMPWGFHVNLIEGSATAVNVGCDGNLYDPAGVGEVLRRYEEILHAIVAKPDEQLRLLTRQAPTESVFHDALASRSLPSEQSRADPGTHANSLVPP